MFFAEHLYLVVGLCLSFFWVLFFLLLKDPAARRRMVVSSIICMILTPLTEYICLVDWWSPHFVAHARIHIEDLLFGFSVSGVISAAYQIIRREKISPGASSRFKFGLFFFTLALIVGLFYILHLNSFWSFTLPFIVVTIIIGGKIPKAVRPMILTGLFMTVLMLPGYLWGIMVHPHWIAEEWLLTGLPAHLVLGIPIGELFWYFLAGTTLGGFQELMR